MLTSGTKMLLGGTSMIAAGLSAYWLTWVLRVLCGSLGLERIRDCKPLCCNVCMAFWASLPFITSWRELFASAGVALITLTLGKTLGRFHV